MAASPLPDFSWRRRFSYLTVATTVLLISWGGFVTSINAGMAFPDWPTSLGSYNWINPVDKWWSITPYLAEHGHRLIASLVGAMTVVLAVWTWRADPRRWMRRLGWGALALVVAQGVLGGLRVLWVSLDLAMVHACVAQIFFALLVAMTLFTTETWRTGGGILPDTDAATRLRRLSFVTTGLIYLQIVLGALLRHPGGGLDVGFAAIHITGAFVVVGLVVGVFVLAQKHFAHNASVRWSTGALLGAVGLQFALGLFAFILMLYEAPQGIRSALQIILTVAHLVVGALLFAASVVTSLLLARTPEEAPIIDTPIRERPASDPVPAHHEA